jgi:hypothetical protein
MAKTVTLNEVDKLIGLYVVVESKFQNESKIEVPELDVVRNEHKTCSQKGEGASLKLKDYARILEHFVDEAAASKTSQRLLFSRAIQNYHDGMDVTKAIKRSRLRAS